MFKFKTQPYAHQLEVFEKFKDSPYFALFMDMGTGKTKVTIDIAAHKFLTGQINAMLIIAPNHVHSQWINEQLPIHCPIPYKTYTWSSARIGSKTYASLLKYFIALPSPNIKIMAVNVEAFQSDTVVPYIAEYVQTHKVFIVVDEATRIKTRTAKRTKTIHKLEKYGQRAILTGTPTAKSPFDLWSQMEFLKSNYFDCNYFIFEHRYGIMIKGTNQYTQGSYQSLIDEKTYAIISSSIRKMRERRNGPLMPDDYEALSIIHGTSIKNISFIESSPEFTRFKRLDELKETIAKDVYSVRKADCLDLPPKIYETIYVTMTPEQAKIYRNLKQELLAYYEDHELSVQNKISLGLRLHQIVGGFFPTREEDITLKGAETIIGYKPGGELIGTSSAKLDAIKADLDEVGLGTKIIIWACFVPELKYIYNELKKDYVCRLYYGGTGQIERSQIIEDFKAGKIDILIGNTATAGLGLNLQNATLQYYYSNSFKTEDRLQSEDRSHRIGVKSPCVYKDIIVKGTIDEKVYASIKTGRDMNDYFKSKSLRELLTDNEEDENA